MVFDSAPRVISPMQQFMVPARIRCQGPRQQHQHAAHPRQPSAERQLHTIGNHWLQSVRNEATLESFRKEQACAIAEFASLHRSTVTAPSWQSVIVHRLQIEVNGFGGRRALR